MATASTALKIVIMGDAKNAQQAFDQARNAASVTAKAVTASFAAAAASFVLIEGAVINTSAEFERFKTQLDTIEGSSTKAAASMDWITQFTKDTPFELATVTDAFVQLKAFGIDPIANDSLKILGNTSAAMGRTLDQSVQALADAATGEFERLKEFGIKARTVGDQVSFSYQQNGHEMVATADKTSQAMIQKTLLGIWNDKYAGGMDKLSKTWDGMMSNMSDSWTIFQKQIGDAGAFDAAKNSLAIVMDELSKNDEAVQGLAFSISDNLVSSMQVGIFAAGELAKAFVGLTVIDDVLRLGVDKTAGVINDAFLKEAKGVSGILRLINDVTGKDLGIANVEATIASMEELGRGITASKAESAQRLGTAVDDAAQSIAEIEALSQRLFLATENSRNVGDQAAFKQVVEAGGSTVEARIIAIAQAKADAIEIADIAEQAKTAALAASNKGNNTNPASGSAASAAPSASSPAVNQALIDAQKIIDIHSLKFQQLQILGHAAFADEQTLLLAKNDADLAALDTEQQRMLDAATLQCANKQQLDDMDAYYQQLKIDRAQQTADQIGEIDTQSTQDKLDRITEGEQAAYDLKAQFQQLVTGNQQVNLDAMAGNIAAFSKASINWEKFTSTQKLQFASAGLSALSGLMSSHSRKQFEVGKAAAQGENAINTYLGATKAYQSLASIPIIGPFLGAAAAGAVVAAGVSNAQKINSAKMGGSTGGVAVPTVSAGGGGSVPTSSINSNTGITQQPSFNPNMQQRPTTPSINIVQHITAPNAQIGAADAIQQAANLGAQQAIAAVSADFTNNGALRQQLAA